MRPIPLLFVLSLAGCAPAPSPETSPAAEAAPQGTTATPDVTGDWVIRAIDGRPLDGPPATIAFADGRISGSTGCNRFSGSYTVAGDRLVIAPPATTRMACPPPLMARETALLAALTGSLEVRAGGGTELTLVAAAGAALTLGR